MAQTSLTALIFDMDGVLVESEGLWRQAEGEVSRRLGLHFTEDDFKQTMGVRMREVAQIWYGRQPWTGPSTDEVAQRVVDRVIELVAGQPMLAGVQETIHLARSRGMKLGLCTSSDTPLVDAVLGSLGLTDTFDAVHSAEDDEFGKPHPMPYLITAELLGVDPTECVVIEDSVTGAVSAKAAQMKVIAVPEEGTTGDGRFGFVDLSLESLTQLDSQMLDAVATGVQTPSLSRPRFHRAFPVDNLDQARWFYGEVLGCREGRSASTWVDFDLFGHQIVAHMAPLNSVPATNDVDGEQVPADHSGLLLNRPAWRDLIFRLEQQGDRIRWLIKPTTRFAGAVGEQDTCFVLDPFGNALEFKAFFDDTDVFAQNSSGPPGG